MSNSFDDLSPVYDVLFDPAWYNYANPEVAASNEDPLRHFVNQGWKEGRDPHPLFKMRWYIERNPQWTAYPNPLVHYYEFGGFSGADPNPLFASDWYAARYPQSHGVNPLEHFILAAEDLQRPHPFVDCDWYGRKYHDWMETGLTPYEHLVALGFEAGRSPHPLFDAAWITDQYGLAPMSAQDVFQYFMEQGSALGLSPHPLFDAEFYKDQLRDSGQPPVSPFLHYMLSDSAHRKAPHLLFDPCFYESQTGELNGKLDPLTHYLTEGEAQGLKPHPLFDPNLAPAVESDQRFEGQSALRRFWQTGSHEGVTPSPLFDRATYAIFNPDVAEQQIEPLLHYVRRAVADRRHPHFLFDADYQRAKGAHADGDALADYVVNRMGQLDAKSPNAERSIAALTSLGGWTAVRKIAQPNTKLWPVHLILKGNSEGGSIGRALDLLRSHLAQDANVSIVTDEAVGKNLFPQIATTLIRKENKIFLYLDTEQGNLDSAWIRRLYALLNDPDVDFAAPAAGGSTPEVPVLATLAFAGRHEAVGRLGGADPDFSTPEYGFADLCRRAWAKRLKTVAVVEPGLSGVGPKDDSGARIDSFLFADKHGSDVGKGDSVRLTPSRGERSR